MRKVSSIVSVSFSKRLSSCINYCVNNKPKYSDNGKIKNRVLKIQARNLFADNIPLDYKIMKSQLNHTFKRKNSVHCIRLINSFSGLSANNPKDLKIAEHLNSQLITNAYGKGIFNICVWQHDGKSHKLHCHNLILNSDPIHNGKSLTHKSRFYRLVKLNHQILKNHDFRFYPLNQNHRIHTTYNGRKLNKIIHKIPSYSHSFKPVRHFKGRVYFPKIFHGKSIISILRSSANRLKYPKDYTKAQKYLKSNDNREDIKAVKLGLIDDKIAAIKSRISERNQIRQIRIEEIKRRRGLQR